MKKIVETLKTRTWSPLEISLSFVIAALGGVIIGMLISPSGIRYFGCYNGNMTHNDSTEDSNNAEDLDTESL